MMSLTFADILFYLLAAAVLIFAAVVAFSKNIVHSGFALMGTFTGVAGLYGLLSANFLAAVQILVYVGGILIVILFAIMLTRNIQEAKLSNPTRKLLLAGMFGLISAALLIIIVVKFPIAEKTPTEVHSTVTMIGDSLLGKYLLPFEILSLLLLATMIGAVMMVRKEIKPEEIKEPRS
jgi:NADH:ubiquinone oxidoreductase subunit 6 (subunit J)